MKKEEYFCDRCGKKLEEHKRIFGFSRKECIAQLELKTDDFLPEYPTPADIGKMAKELANKEYDYMDITLHGLTRNKNIELCGNCRKDFEEFMKNA